MLNWSLFAGDRPLLTRHHPISVAPNVAERLDRLAAAAASAGDGDLDSATLRLLSVMRQSMRSNKREETSFPGAVILAEGESLVAAKQRQQPCSGWPTLDRRAPPEAPAGGAHRDPSPRRHPRTVARRRRAAWRRRLGEHGLDAYGNGALVQACVERGWFVIAPRCSLLGGVDLPALLEAMAARWPIDRQRIVPVGHSMGAMQSIATIVAMDADYRAVAALGGGRVPKDARLDLPGFVGVGSRDFARGNSVQPHAALRRAGSNSELREYAEVEHLTVVQIATPDVVALFAEIQAPEPR